MDMEDIDSGVVDQSNADNMDIEQVPSPSPDPWLNKLAVPSFYPIYRRCRGTFSLVPIIIEKEKQIVNSFLTEQP